MTDLVLVQKRYVPVEAVKAPEMPNFATAHVLGLRRSTPLPEYVSFKTQDSQTRRLSSRLSLTAWRIQRVSLVHLLGGPQIPYSRDARRAEAAHGC